MTKEDAAQRRIRAADERVEAAERTCTRGSNMMISGAVLLAGATATFAGFDSTQIESWVRQVILTIIAILFSTGAAIHFIGRSDTRRFGQMADDRAAQEERHEAEVALLCEIKGNQRFLMARPGAGTTEISYRVRPPSQDTLDLVRRARMEGEQAPPEVPKQPEGLDIGQLMENAEWFNLGAKIEKRKHDPDAQN